MKTPRPEKLTVTTTLTGKALDIVLDEKEKYDKQKRMISKSEIINKLIISSDKKAR